MNTRISTAILLLLPALSFAQVPVDDDGNVIGQYESQSNITPIVDDGIPRLAYAELQELVGPIALYPDDLLAIVLPASAYPLQIVEAYRFLKALESDSSLQPDPDWDDSIIAILNYPEVVELLNEDLDWTLRLGEAVVAQQTDVVAAIEAFRDRAYAAGNLKSDEYQNVANDDGVIRITPVAEDVIYVPYYEPARVVYYQPRPVYHYYPSAYPVYYYPYASNHYFHHGYFWGVTTAFSIGWMSDSLHVHHHSYNSHPYYGRTYWNDGWYRRPSISVYNRTYVNNNIYVNRNNHGDQWRASNTRRQYIRREGYSRTDRRLDERRDNRSPDRMRVGSERNETISFRERDSQTTRTRQTARISGTSPKETRQRATNERSQIQFAPRDQNNARTEPVRRQEPATRVQPRTRTQPAVRSQPVTRQQPTTRPTQARAPSTRQTVAQPPRQQRASPPPRPQRSSPPPRQQRSAPPPRESRSSESRSKRSESRSTERRSRER